MTRRLRLLGWALFAALLLAYDARHLSFVTDITNFLPDGSRSELARLSRELAHSELARSMALTIGADDPARAVLAAREMAEGLRAHPEVAWLRASADAEMQQRIYELYFPRRHYFLSDRPEDELPPLLSDAGLRAQAARVRETLALPVSPLLKRILPEDPLGAFSGILERLAGGEPPLAMRDGGFVTRDGRWAVILLATRHSAFDTVVQGPFLDAIHARFAEARARHGDDLVLEISGANRFALQAEGSIRADAYRIGAFSLLGVGALFLFFFRSPRALVLALAPALVGVVVGLSACIAVFGRLDGMTVAFGASLIGSTIDYPVHVLNLWSLAPPGTSAWDIARRLRGSLVLAASTTVAGFIGLAATEFQGFRELGVFATAGIAASLLATLWLLPDLLPPGRSVPPLSERVALGLAGSVEALRPRRRVLLALPLAALALAAVALPRLAFVDDLASLGEPDAALLAEEQRVRERLSSFDGGRLVVTIADGPEEAISRNEAVHARLGDEVEAGRLGGMRSFHDLLWSESLQRRNLAALHASEDLPARLDAAFQQAGFRAGAFAPFAAALAAPPPPLTLDELRASPLGELAASLVLDLGGRTGIVTYLRGVEDAEAVKRSLADLPGVHWFEQRAFLNEIFATFRDRTLRQTALGGLLVLPILAFRYRGLRRALAAYLPSVLSAGVVLSIFAVLGHPVTLIHAVALLVVMGMGVDFGIYLVDSVGARRKLGATLMSILLCAGSTGLTFGALALSSHPALRAIGLTSGLGIALAFVFAPATLLLLRAEAPGSGAEAQPPSIDTVRT
jgi:predicted exporter